MKGIRYGITFWTNKDGIRVFTRKGQTGPVREDSDAKQPGLILIKSGESTFLTMPPEWPLGRLHGQVGYVSDCLKAQA